MRRCRSEHQAFVKMGSQPPGPIVQRITKNVTYLIRRTGLRNPVRLSGARERAVIALFHVKRSLLVLQFRVSHGSGPARADSL